jgi:hypothetical protein
MAKLYGVIVGSQVNLLLTGGIGIVPPDLKDTSDLVIARDYVTFAGNVIGDQVSLGVFRSSAYIDLLSSYVLRDALGAGCTCNIGDITYPSGFVAGLNLNVAGWVQVKTGMGAAGMAGLLWSKIGYPSDPGGNIEILLTLAGANPGAGSFGWQFSGRNH